MNGQAIVVALVVAACTLYAAWTLMPRAGRRAIASAALRHPWPPRMRRFLERHAQADAGCGCDGCDVAEARRAAPAAPAGTQPITFHRRPPR